MQYTLIIFFSAFFILSTNAQTLVDPDAIEIGDVSQLPGSPGSFDAPLKIITNNQENGVVIIKNTDPGKNGTFQALNDADIKLNLQVGGSARSDDYLRNCASLVTYSEQYGTQALRYFVIGNKDAAAPILFIQDNQEIARIDEDGNIELASSNAGVILTSENGTKYKIKVDDDGNLFTESP